MNPYTRYLLHQQARFGALRVDQMLRICEGKCKISALYKAIKRLGDLKFLSLMMDMDSRARAYYPTTLGKKAVFGNDYRGASGIRSDELGHTLDVTDVLLELCSRENITG